MRSLRIRHADAVTDSAACAEIYAPFVENSPVSFEERPPDAHELGRRIELTSRTHPWLVAQVDDRVVGYAYATSHRPRAAYQWAADVAVYVAPDQRRQGVGRALYGALLPLLVRQGLRIACAGIALPNDASVALHELCGFEPVGVYRRIGWKAGAWRDVGWWQAELVEPSPGRPPEPGRPARLVLDRDRDTNANTAADADADPGTDANRDATTPRRGSAPASGTRRPHGAPAPPDPVAPGPRR